MRRAIAVVLVALLASGCARPYFGHFPAVGSPTTVTSFDAKFASELGKKAMPAAGQVRVTGSKYNFDTLLHMLGGSPPGTSGRQYAGAWRMYFGRLQDARLNVSSPGSPPHAMRSLELTDQTPRAVCDYNPQDTLHMLGPPGSVQYCRANAQYQKDDQRGLMLLPQGYGANLRQLAAQHDARWGWLAATIVASVVYAQHLRYELGDPGNAARAGVAWPIGSEDIQLPFDACVAGISVRAIFPVSFLDEALDIVRKHSGDLGLDTKHSGLPVAFRVGMQTGQLSKCPSA